MAIFTQIGGISTGSITNVLKGPLSKLFGSKTGASHYKYPDNLTSDPSRMHFIQFEISNIMPVKFDFSGDVTDFNDVITMGGTIQDVNVATGFFADSGRLGNTVLQSGPVQGTIGAAKSLYHGEKVQAQLEKSKRQSMTFISLYMPDTLNMTYGNSYEHIAMPTAGRVMEKVGELAHEFEQAKGSSAGRAVKSIKSVAGSDATLQDAIVRNFVSEDTADLLLKAQGQAINPQIQMLYRGNGFRKFQFEFILTAKSKEESDQISAICNAFIFASSPSVSSASGMFFIPPSVFNIKLMMSKNTNLGGISAMLQKAGNNLVPGLDLGTKIGSAMGGSSAEENTRLFKTGDCVLEDVIVDYAPDGWAAHSGGAPLQTRLTLQFSEIHIVQRERLLKGEIR